MIPQEERERRFRAINDMLMPYVKTDGDPSWVLASKYEFVHQLCKGLLWGVSKDGDWWEIEPKLGSPIGDACTTAYNLQTLTGDNVRVRFNGVSIEMRSAP